MTLQQIPWGDVVDMVEHACASAKSEDGLERLTGLNALLTYTRELRRRVIAEREIPSSAAPDYWCRVHEAGLEGCRCEPTS